MALDIFPYQDEGGLVLAHKSRFGLHDEMGLGKSAQVWRAVDYLAEKDGLRRPPRGIIICPATLRQNWINEHYKFSKYRLRVTKGNSRTDLIAWLRGVFDVIVLSYERATRWAERIRNEMLIYDFCAIDEAHYLKNAQTARTKAIFGAQANGMNSLIDFAVHVWHVTGTPMSNDPMDIYTFLKMCRAVDMTHNQFMYTYFDVKNRAYNIRTSPKANRIEELRSLIASCSIRRTKKSVGLQMPPIFLNAFTLEGDTTNIQQLFEETPGLDEAVIEAVRAGSIASIDAPAIATLRRLIGEAKAVPYADMLANEIKYGVSDKKVVFGVHKSGLSIIESVLEKNGIKSVKITGDTPEKERDKLKDIFQNDKDCKVFIGNIRAAGTGLTLTASCEIDMFESDWSPAGNAQAIMRVHRIGQTRNVFGRFITLADSIDEDVNDIVVKKTVAIATIDSAEMIAAPV